MPQSKTPKIDRPLIAIYHGGPAPCFDPRDFIGADGDFLRFMVSEANRGFIPVHALLRTNLIILDLHKSLLEFRDTLNPFPYEVQPIDLTNYEVWLFRENFQKKSRWQRFVSLLATKKELVNG